MLSYPSDGQSLRQLQVGEQNNHKRFTYDPSVFILTLTLRLNKALIFFFNLALDMDLNLEYVLGLVIDLDIDEKSVLLRYRSIYLYCISLFV